MYPDFFRPIEYTLVVTQAVFSPPYVPGLFQTDLGHIGSDTGSFKSALCAQGVFPPRSIQVIMQLGKRMI